MNALALAYLGDAVYELWVRTHLLECGYEKVKDLHHQATDYVRAATQAQLLQELMPELTETENQVVMRGRNTKGAHPKSTDVITYRHATAFEALVGYWQLTGQEKRMTWAFNQADAVVAEGKSQKNKAVKTLDVSERK